MYAKVRTLKFVCKYSYGIKYVCKIFVATKVRRDRSSYRKSSYGKSSYGKSSYANLRTQLFVRDKVRLTKIRK